MASGGELLRRLWQFVCGHHLIDQPAGGLPAHSAICRNIISLALRAPMRRGSRWPTAARHKPKINVLVTKLGTQPPHQVTYLEEFKAARQGQPRTPSTGRGKFSMAQKTSSNAARSAASWRYPLPWRMQRLQVGASAERPTFGSND